MFCEKCGRELQEDWQCCPYCTENDVNEEQISTSTQRVTKEKLEEKLERCSSEKKSGGVSLIYGTGAISKDLLQVLYDNEELVCLEFAYRNGILGRFKQGKGFRNYIVCTNERMIYLEKARMVLSLLPFLHKTISIPYQNICKFEPCKRIGIFSGLLKIETDENRYSFQVKNYKVAEELTALIMEKSDFNKFLLEN